MSSLQRHFLHKRLQIDKKKNSKRIELQIFFAKNIYRDTLTTEPEATNSYIGVIDWCRIIFKQVEDLDARTKDLKFAYTFENQNELRFSRHFHVKALPNLFSQQTESARLKLSDCFRCHVKWWVFQDIFSLHGNKVRRKMLKPLFFQYLFAEKNLRKKLCTVTKINYLIIILVFPLQLLENKLIWRTRYQNKFFDFHKIFQKS